MVSEIVEPGSVTLVSVRAYAGGINGVTAYERNKDYFHDISFMENRVTALLAGKAATEIIFGKADTGVQSDMRRAFSIVERFVDDYCAYGFNTFESQNSSGALLERKENTIALKMAEFYDKAKAILINNRELLLGIADMLMEKDTITHKDINDLKDSLESGRTRLCS